MTRPIIYPASRGLSIQFLDEERTSVPLQSKGLCSQDTSYASKFYTVSSNFHKAFGTRSSKIEATTGGLLGF